MPIHDWTRVGGAYHDFHQAWLTHLKECLNGGVLPPGYYAQMDRRVGLVIPDIVAFHTSRAVAAQPITAEAAPAVTTTTRPIDRPTRRRPLWWIDVRQANNHQVVAVIEVTSPANKHRRRHVDQLADKIAGLLSCGVHALLIDLFPPGAADPRGIHGAVWSRFDRRPYRPAADTPLMLASYQWDGDDPVAYLEPTAVGRALKPMPLFLPDGGFVNVPLEETYLQAYRGVAEVWRQVLEAPPGAPA